MKKFLLILLVMCVGFQGALLAQTKTVTGQVTGGDDGLGIPRANVTVKGTTRGTPTDLDGNYTIEVSADETLVFSFIGYVTQEILVGNQTTINVVLQPDAQTLEEVVVVGYGSQERKEITSAVASIKPEDFNQGNIPNPTQLLQGKVAGLQVTKAGGDPNGNPEIRLRGLSTFGANTAPLIVLDGVPGADLANVDPNDIASIDVLKDGSAAAIYGARASSGVILITTTKGSGETGISRISINSFVAVDQAIRTIDVLSPEEFVARGGEDFNSRTDWFDVLTQDAVSYTTNASVSGSFGATNYRASVNYRNNNGIIKGVSNERLNTRLNLSHTALNDKLRLNFNVSVTNREFETKDADLFRYTMIYNPTAPIYDDLNTANDGGFFQRDLFDFFNPEALRQQQLRGGIEKNLLTTYRAEYDILDNLTAMVQYTQDRRNTLRGEYDSRLDPQVGFGARGRAARFNDDMFTQILTATLTYDTEIATDLRMTALIGAEQQRRRFEGFGARARQFLFDSNTWNNLGAGAIRVGQNTDLYSYFNEDQLNSTFTRFNFNYKGAYFVSASLRVDSFSGFGADEKTGYFPTISAGAELTELADLGPISSLKARVSYGITGALPFSADQALPVFGNQDGRVDLDGDPLTTDDVFVGIVQRQNANQELRWETKKEFNIGVDFSVLDGKITGTMDYYTRNIEDLIFRIQVPIGAPNPFDNDRPTTALNTFVNLADLSSAGFEFAASYNEVNLGPVKWTPGINFTIYDKATVESLSVGEGLGFDFIRPFGSAPGSPGQNNNPTVEARVGSTVGNFWGPRFLGVDENNEWILSAGVNDTEQFEIIGNGLPDGDFGFQNNFEMGNWSMSFLLRGTFGHEMYNSFRGFYENQDPASNTWNSVVTDKTIDIVSTPTFSDLYIEDASFIRLDNLQIGYNIPTESDWLENLRIYAGGQNLFTITNYTGLDPEFRVLDPSQLGDGVDAGRRQDAALSPGIERRDQFFPVRTYTLGVNLTIK